jgi:arabinogalactan oligomer / maltooligosaccharide transport system permease protein
MTTGTRPTPPGAATLPTVWDRVRRVLRGSREPQYKLPPLRPARWFVVVGWRHLVLILGCLFAVYPVVWIISASLNPVDNLQAAKLIPDNANLDNFRELFDNDLTPFMTWLRNSWFVALAASVVNVLLASLAAYAFSRLRFKGRRVGLLTLLLVQVFPQFLGFIALFLLLQSLGSVFPSIGINTLWGLILVYSGGAIGFNAYLIKGFMDSVPASLDESAVVDGASPWMIFWRIILPLARPALAVIFIITFINLYAEFILAATLLRSVDNYTYAVGLRLFVQSEYAAKWGQLGAAALIGAAPIVVTFLFAQRSIISGLTQGAVKG